MNLLTIHRTFRISQPLFLPLNGSYLFTLAPSLSTTHKRTHQRTNRFQLTTSKLPALAKPDHISLDSARTCNARATLDEKPCAFKSTLFEMNPTCTLCDLNLGCLSTPSTSSKVFQYPNPIWSTVFTFRVFKFSFCEFMTMAFPCTNQLHKSNFVCII